TQRPDGGIPLCTRIRGVGGHPVFLSGRRDYQHHCGPTTNKSGGWGPASNPLGGRGRTPGGRSSASNRFYSHGPTTPAHKLTVAWGATTGYGTQMSKQRHN